MANNIVFQNSADQLKTAIYGYNGSNYQPLQVTSTGTLQTKIAGGSVRVSGGTATVALKSGNATVEIKAGSSIRVSGGKATVALKSGNATVEIKAGSSIRVSGGKATVALKSGNATVEIKAGSSIRVSGGTATVALKSGNATVEIKAGSSISVNNTVKINIVDRTFYATTQTAHLTSTTATYTNLIDISKYQDTSWYIKKSSTGTAQITVTLVTTPSSTIASYPRAATISSATVTNANIPKVIPNSNYLKWAAAYLTTSTSVNQTIRIVFNGRY